MDKETDLDVHNITLTDDYTSRSAAEVMSQLQLDRGSPKGSEACQQLLRDLDFQNEHQDEEEYTQFVFQGQCLILGDSRVGKTSLVKSLTGKPFDSEEPSTRGVQSSLVDQNWTSLSVDTSLLFGSFDRFWASVRSICASFDSRGYKNLSDQETTSVLSPDCKFWLKHWLVSFICLLILATPSVTSSFCVFSLMIALLTTSFGSSQKLFLVCPVSFTIGLLIAYMLAGYLKGVYCSKEMICDGTKPRVPLDIEIWGLPFFLWAVHLYGLAHLVNDITSDLLDGLLVQKYLKRVSLNNRPYLPGQFKCNIKKQVLSAKIVASQIASVITAFSLGCAHQLLAPIEAYKYCLFLHVSIYIWSLAFIFWFIRALCRDSKIMEGIATPILFILVIENTPCNLISFCSMAWYTVMFAGCACYSISILINNLLKDNSLDGIHKLVYVNKVALDYQTLRTALNAKFSSLKLGILDFAGDEEYHAYHHLFLRNQAIYVVAFNMEHFVTDNFKTIVEKIQRLYFWLESICSQVAPKTPIFLVGTHRGSMSKSCIDRLDRHLQHHLWQSFSDELVMNEDGLTYFPVENTQGKNDQGIQNLQRKITYTAEKCKETVGRKIPFSWIKIQDAIISQRKSKKAKLCVTLDKFPTSLGEFICSNWSKDTLRYFHEKGLVIYVDPGQDSELSKWVLLEPSILIDVIIQLVTPPTGDEVILQQGFRRDWVLLHNSGMLTESLLRHILHRSQENEEAMKGFLEEYDIICPLFYKVNDKKEEAKVTHFVPALLPMSVNGNTPVWHDDPTDKRFFVFFKRFLPEPLFHYLLSRAHRHSIAGFSKGQPIIYRDVGRFWFTPTQPYRLLVLKKENMIEVTFSCRSVLNNHL